MISRDTFWQFFRFGIVGGIGFCMDAALLYLGINVLGLGRITAALFSFPPTVTVTWIGNRLFTFRHAPRVQASKQLAKFATVCAIGLIFNRGTYALLVSTVPLVYQYPILGLLGGTCAGMFFNFFAAKRHVFAA